MNKLAKSILALTLSFVFAFSFSGTVFALDYAPPNLAEMVSVSYKNKVELRTMNTQDILRIKNTKAKTFSAKSDQEKMEDILDALKVSVSAEQLQHLHSTVSLQEIESAFSSIRYIKTYPDGTQETITEKDIPVDAYEISETSASISPAVQQTSSHGSSVYQSPNGYMRLQILVFYTPDYNGPGTTIGRYVCMGFCEWVIRPLIRSTDAISLGGFDFRWDEKAPQDFNLLYSCKQTVTNLNTGAQTTQHITSSKDGSQASVSSYTGVYFTFGLPADYKAGNLQYQFSEFNCMITGVGRVQDYDDITQNLGIDLRYAHTQTTITPSFKWSSGLPQVEINLFLGKKYYDHNYSWDYKIDF